MVERCMVQQSDTPIALYTTIQTSTGTYIGIGIVWSGCQEGQRNNFLILNKNFNWQTGHMEYGPLYTGILYRPTSIIL